MIIAAFEGWNDAGEAASGAITHLSEAWQAAPVGAIDPEDYYDFQVTRPVTEVTDGKTQRLIWPTTRLLQAHAARIDRDVVLVHGIEPNMRWRRFCTELVEAFAELRAELVVLLGALLADSPHTRPVPVTSSASEPGARGRPASLARRLQGPHRDHRRAAARMHRGGHPGPVAVGRRAALRRPAAEPEGDPGPGAGRRGPAGHFAAAGRPARQEARAWERGVDELAEQDSEVAEYVRTLEEAKDATELPEASGDAIAAEFERYLRRRRE